MEMPYIPEGLRILAAEGELDAFLSGVREYGELCARMAREQERERCALIAQDMDYGLGDLAAEIRKR